MEKRIVTITDLLKEPGYVYQVPDSNLGAQVRVSVEDNILVSAYREANKKPRSTIIHLMIGQATKCWEEKHDEKISELEELQLKLLVAEHIMELYKQKYGPLPPLRRYKVLGKQ